MGHFWLLLQLYGGVYNLFRSGLPRMGIDVTMVDIFDLNDLKKCLRSQTKLVWLEACTNPLVMLADLGRDHLLSFWRFVAPVYDSTMEIWSVCNYYNQWQHSLEIFVSFISFFILFLVTFGDEFEKIHKYYIIFVCILQGKMGKTEKNRKKITQLKWPKYEKPKDETMEGTKQLTAMFYF